MACGILVPWPGIELMPPVLEARSLNHWTARKVLPSFLFPFSFFFYSVQLQWFPWLSCSSVIYSSVSLSLLLIPSSVFSMSLIIFFICLVVLYIFPLLKKKILTFLPCSSSLLLLSSLIIFTPLPWTLSWVNCLSPPHLVLVPSFGTCSSVASFCLTCCFLFLGIW